MDQNYNQQPQPVYGAVQQPNVLVFGILSLVLCGIVGLIMGIIGRKKGNAFVAQGGQLAGAAKTGFILSKVGIILSIIAIVVEVIICIVAAATGSFLSSLK